MLVGELIGRWLWASDRTWVAFAGAMLATACAAAGLWMIGRAAVKMWDNRHVR